MAGVSGGETLVLMVPRALRDDIIDVLMADDTLRGFSVTPAQGFSRNHAGLDLREQVKGYREFERFEVNCTATQRELLFPKLAAAAGSEHLHYWLTPVLEEGRLSGETGA